MTLQTSFVFSVLIGISMSLANTAVASDRIFSEGLDISDGLLEVIPDDVIADPPRPCYPCGTWPIGIPPPASRENATSLAFKKLWSLLKKAHISADLNGDGVVSPEEAQQALSNFVENLGEQGLLTESQVKDLLDRIKRRNKMEILGALGNPIALILNAAIDGLELLGVLTEHADTNGDGMLSAEELEALGEAMFDSNGDGVWTIAEMQTYLNNNPDFAQALSENLESLANGIRSLVTLYPQAGEYLGDFLP